MLRSDPKAHKYDFGHVLVVAGSAPMLGAAALCGLAAMRAGAGLTTCAVGRSLNGVLQKKLSPVIMTMPLPEASPGVLSLSAFSHIQKIFKKITAIALGPGLGKHRQTQGLVLKLVGCAPAPMVIDADGLNLLANNPAVLRAGGAAKILTPHEGEMARLMGCSAQQVAANRRQAATHFAREHNCVVVLKGQRTVVCSPKGKLYLNRTGNAGLAKAGTGDVLTGIIAGLLAQGISPFNAACTGVYVHGRAGDIAARKKSKAAMIATDVIEFLPQVLARPLDIPNSTIEDHPRRK